MKYLQIAYEHQPQNYEELVLVPGIGAKSIRALALISDLVYGTHVSWKDPAKYAFAHGGKDGIPYPVNRVAYDENINLLKTAVDNAKLGNREKLLALRKLSDFYETPS
jgi:hypothetical protein